MDLSLVTAMLSEAVSPDVGSAVVWLGQGRQGVCCQAYTITQAQLWLSEVREVIAEQKLICRHAYDG